MRPARKRTIHVLLVDQVHALDLAGPVQSFFEADNLGGGYELQYVGSKRRVVTAQGFTITDVAPLPVVQAADLVLVPGMSSEIHDQVRVPTRWLSAAHESGATIASICSGALVLARARLLDGRRCTTHWKMIDALRAATRDAQVLENRLYARDDSIWTSAGLASGIDMALAMIDEDYGPLVAVKVAREMVVYMRRHSDAEQRSPYFDHRAHLHPGIHRVQDWILTHPDQNPTLAELAEISGMSERNLTRVFRQTTGITLKTFSNQVKIEVARRLLDARGLTLDDVAARCGYQDGRQLRRLWRSYVGCSLSEYRSTLPREEIT